MDRSATRRCGALELPGGAVCWRVWAPRARQVDLVLLDGGRRRLVPMATDAGGYFHHEAAHAPEGQRYFFRLDGGAERADPCSLWQPEGVFGPSALVRPGRFAWTDQTWQGVPRPDLVFYELHVGTFTPEGTFAAIVSRLPALKELGITAIELMPIGQFPGTRNWGYDGVLPYAAQDTYGGPHGLQELVDACHAHGLALFLDVVYNHLGPEGNFLGEFGPYFTDHYRTPWGQAVNFDDGGSDAVRDFVLDNARLWLEEFHVDGLRLDAIHAIYDLGAHHILRAIQEVADDVAGRSGRAVHIVAESSLNDPRLLWPVERGGHNLGAQWTDDFHHAVHAYLTGEQNGYYEDFGAPAQIARALEQPFLFTGQYSKYRHRKHGAPADGLAGDRFVVCLQNHDQVGNRATGDRLSRLLRSPAQWRLATSLLLLSPYLPLLFMGEEYGEENPFPFFCSFGDAGLVQAVRQGRRREFARFTWQGEVPDPHGEDTFASARLSWSWPEGTLRAGLRRLHADLLAARRRWPALRDFEARAARLLPDPVTGPVVELIRGDRRPEPGQTIQAFFNLRQEAQPLPAAVAGGQACLLDSEAGRYGGPRQGKECPRQLRGHECLVFGPADWYTPG
jgi:maltooligosyltrehalose trehalohydrolase